MTESDRYELASKTFHAVLSGIAGDEVEVREVRITEDGPISHVEVTVPSRETAALLIGRRGRTIRGIHGIFSAALRARAPYLKVMVQEGSADPEVNDLDKTASSN